MRLTRDARRILLLLLPFAAGCAAADITSLASLSAGQDPPIRTDAASYQFRAWGHNGVAADIPIRFHNVTGRTLHIVNCHGQLAPVLQKRVGDEWQDFWSPVLLMCLSSPIVIPAGRTLERTIQVYGTLPSGNSSPEFRSDDVDGTYRIVLGSIVLNYDSRRQQFGDPVPIEYRVSNEFELRRPAD